LSDPQEIALKIGQKMGNLNPLIFERNRGKDHKDAAKSPAVSNNYAI